MFIKKKNKSHETGISLVELMILIFIIAILGSVTYPHILGIYRRGREASLKSNMFTLSVAAENFASMAHGLYPVDPTYTVQDVLSDIGIPSSNQMRLADNCPATCFDVNTGSDYALLPGNRTYINPFLFNGNCLAINPNPGGLPGHCNIIPYNSGQGTVYWDPFFPMGTFATPGYIIWGDGYRYVLYFHIRSEY